MSDTRRKPTNPMSAAVAALGLALGVTDPDDLERIWQELRSSQMASGPAEAVCQFRMAAIRAGIVLPDLTAKLTAKVTENTPRHTLAQGFETIDDGCAETPFD